MNNKLITLVVSATLAAPFTAIADTTLYGRIDISVNTDDIDSITFTNGVAGTPTKDSDGWDIRNETSRIGVKGSEDLGNSLKAIFQAEWAFEGAEGGSYASESGGQSVFRNRLAYAGLSGSWGTAAMGRQWTPYFGAVNKADIYNKGDINPQYLGTSRIGNAITYKSPNLKGFSGALLLSVDKQSNLASFNNNKKVDQWNFSLNYDNGPLSLGFGFLEEKKHGKGATDVIGKYQMTGIGGSYMFNGIFKLIGQYESGMHPGDTLGNTFDISEWTIAGEYNSGNNIFRGSYADYGKDLNGSNFWALGWQYNFSKRNRVYAEYFNGEAISHRNVELTPSGDVSIPVEDGNSFGFGIRHDF